MRKERDREQWFRIGDQVRFVPLGKLPEEVGVDTRMAVELPREPAPFERHVAGRWWTSQKAKTAHDWEAGRRRGDWHRDIEGQLAALRGELAEVKARLAAHQGEG
jgi:uncharacterized protein YceH (UPF0502 family)